MSLKKKLLLIGLVSSSILYGENTCSPPFAVGIDYLYWETEQDGMDYGSITTTQTTSLSEDLSGLPVNPNTIDAANAKIIRSNFKYESGVRALLGYAPPCAGFNCNLIYTYLPNNVKKNTIRESTETISSVFTTLPLSSLKSKWSSSFNQLDLDFGRTINLGSLFEIGPHIGARGVIADQRFSARSNFLNPAIDGVSPPIGTNTTFNRFKQNYYGIGVEGGMWASINLGCGVSFIGHCGGAILYSKFKVKNEYEAAIIAEDTSTPTALSHDHDTLWAPTPVFDYFIGLNYGTQFCQTYLNFHVGWEQHVFFDMNRLQVGNDEYGNFSTAGLTVGIDCMF